MARSNGELVARARQMTADAGRRPATVDEARALLGLAQRSPRGRGSGQQLAQGLAPAAAESRS
jgi:hypothetical protein